MQEETSFRLVRNLNGDIWHSDSRRASLAGMTIIIGIHKAKLLHYFRLSEVKGIFEELDGWIRRKLRCILWRQWKRSWTRFKNLMKLGLAESRARLSAFNGRGAWWNSGASHMNKALPKKFFDRLGLMSLLDQIHHLQDVK